MRSPGAAQGHLLAAALALLTACGSSDDVRITLSDRDGDAGAALASVKTLSIEAVATAGRCRLADQCAFDVHATSVDDLNAALRFTDVLLSLDAGDAQTLVIDGRPLADCFPRDDGSNHPVLCGYATFAQVAGGALTIELAPDLPGGACPESLALCP